MCKHCTYYRVTSQTEPLLMVYFVGLTKLVAPSASPAINAQETKAEDAHTIRVKWHEINKKDQNGIILGYFVYYNEKGDLNTDRQQVTATNTIITGLKPYTEYCIKLEGFTMKGASPTGSCFFVTTSESGRQLQKGPF